MVDSVSLCGPNFEPSQPTDSSCVVAHTLRLVIITS